LEELQKNVFLKENVKSRGVTPLEMIERFSPYNTQSYSTHALLSL
jgi:hypothetical protein